MVNSDESNSEADFLLRAGTILLGNERQKIKNYKSYTHNSFIENAVGGDAEEYDYIETDHSEVGLVLLKKKTQFMHVGHSLCHIVMK